MVTVNYNFNITVSSTTQKIYMETGPGYNNTSYSNTNSLQYFAVDGITAQSEYVKTNLPIYINRSGKPSIIDVLEIVNNTNLKGIPVYIYFNTNYNIQNNKLPKGLTMYYSTQLYSNNPDYYQITPGNPIHLTDAQIYLSFDLSNNGKINFELYLIFQINGIIITYSYPVYLNYKP